MSFSPSQDKNPVIELTSNVIHGFTNSVLLSRFDNPKPTPKFHDILWDYCCSSNPYVAIAAPRGHAKSTAVTHTYTLASIVFRLRRFALLAAQTEGQAIQFLGDLKKEFYENDALINLFGVGDVIKDTESDVIVQFKDKSEARIIVRGSGQQVRGLKWRNTRPDLIIGDDLENDEIVLNDDRRAKFKSWVFNALLPCGADDALVRFVGTILHMDSMLESTMPNKTRGQVITTPLMDYYVPDTHNRSIWHSIKFRAHPGLDDFSEILWPEKFPEERLRAIRQTYIEQGTPEGYSQEYLNNPIDESHAFFKRKDILDIPEYEAFYSKTKEPETFYAAIDMAISEKSQRARTAIAICGISPTGMLRVRDIIKGRWDSLEIVENMFYVQERYRPQLFWVEEENISRAVGPFLYEEMRKPDRPFINLDYVKPSNDKLIRARPLQARMRAKGVQFDKQAEWFASLEEEIAYFPRGKFKDQVDALSYICLKLDEMTYPLNKEEQAELEYQQEYEESIYFSSDSGANPITGY